MGIVLWFWGTCCDVLWPFSTQQDKKRSGALTTVFSTACTDFTSCSLESRIAGSFGRAHWHVCRCARREMCQEMLARISVLFLMLENFREWGSHFCCLFCCSYCCSYSCMMFEYALYDSKRTGAPCPWFFWHALFFFVPCEESLFLSVR